MTRVELANLLGTLLIVSIKPFLADTNIRLEWTLEKLGNAKAALLAYDAEIAWGSPNHSDVKKRQAGVYQKLHGSLQSLNRDEFNRVNTLAMPT